MQLLRLTFVCFILTLSACEHSIRRDPVFISEKIDEDIDEAQSAQDNDSHTGSPIGQASKPMAHVTIPRDSYWLRDKIADITYHDTSAEVAIERVLGHRPYKFDVIVDPITVDENGNPTNAPYDPRLVSVSSPVDGNTVHAHLNSIAVQSGMDYSIENGVVVFSNVVLKTYHLKASTSFNELAPQFSPPAGTIEGATQFSNSQGIWNTINTSLGKIMTSPNYFVLDYGSNSITLGGSKTAVTRGLNYLKTIDFASSRRVKLKFEVYGIDLTAISQREVDFTLEALTDRFLGINDVNAGGSFIGNLIGSNQDGGGLPSTLNIDVEPDADRLAGAQAMLRFLRGKGAITSRYITEIVGTNNQLAEDIDTEVTPYVSNVRQNIVVTGSTSSDQNNVETKEANDGISIQFVPTITDDHISVKLLFEDSRLIDFISYDVAGSQGNLALTSLSRQRHTFSLRNGETIALTGKVVERRSHDSEDGALLPIATSVNANEARTQNLILVTALNLD